MNRSKNRAYGLAKERELGSILKHYFKSVVVTDPTFPAYDIKAITNDNIIVYIELKSSINDSIISNNVNMSQRTQLKLLCQGCNVALIGVSIEGKYGFIDIDTFTKMSGRITLDYIKRNGGIVIHRNFSRLIRYVNRLLVTHGHGKVTRDIP